MGGEADSSVNLPSFDSDSRKILCASRYWGTLCEFCVANAFTVAMVGCEPVERVSWSIMLNTDPKMTMKVASRHIPMRLIFWVNGTIQSKWR